MTKFDDLLDPAFGEIYCKVWDLEKNNAISAEDGCEEIARTCKRLAAEFVEAYEKACALGGEPDYWDCLDLFAVKRLVEEYPPNKHYEVTVGYVVKVKRKVEAPDRDRACFLAKLGGLNPHDLTLSDTEISDWVTVDAKEVKA